MRRPFTHRRRLPARPLPPCWFEAAWSLPTRGVTLSTALADLVELGYA